MRYFSFDAETDGLYGEAFAIGAVVVDESGTILDSFSGKCVSPGVANPWVIENCLPFLDSLPEYESREALRSVFWEFYMSYRESTVPMADVPYPVEAALMRACVEQDLDNRTFLGPYPLIDLASALYARGVDPHINRREFSGHIGPAHNPLDDAIASALCMVKLLKE